MGLFDKLEGEFIDIIEWLDDSNDTLAYRFERYNNEIKNEAKLTVRESQIAVFVNEGSIADVFFPGMYMLSTRNLPILSTLKGWDYGFNSPFKAEVYFINTRNITAQKWGTRNPIILNDERFGMLEIRAFGTYVLKVSDPVLFIKEIVGTDGHFTTDEVTEQLNSMIISQFTDTVGEANIPVESYAAKTNEISDEIGTLISSDFEKYGIEITKFVIENVSMPEEIKKEIFELSRLNRINLGKLTQMKAAKAIEKSAKNPSGTAGAGMGMGMGFAMANQMGNVFSQNPNQNTTQNNATPPPLPNAIDYFVAINGQQGGPYNKTGIQELIKNNQMDRNSLVWKEGMANWIAAHLVPEINALFGAVPPPLPNR